MGKTRRYDIVRACEEEYRRGKKTKKPWIPRGEMMPPPKTFKSKKDYDRNKHNQYIEYYD